MLRRPHHLGADYSLAVLALATVLVIREKPGLAPCGWLVLAVRIARTDPGLRSSSRPFGDSYRPENCRVALDN
jgi:hypothetical protein